MVQQNFVMDCLNVVGGVVARKWFVVCQKICNGLLECGWWCCGSNVVCGLPVTMYELGLIHITYTIFKFHDGHENFLPYGKHTTMCNNVNQHHIKT